MCDFGWEDEWIELAEDNLAAGKWQTKNGYLFKLTEMETVHIQNCIALIQRRNLHINYATFADYIDAFQSELKRRENESQRLRDILTNGR